MTSIDYVFELRNSGVLTAGVTPTITTAKRIANGANLSATPTITEIGGGLYKISYDPESSDGEAGIVIDAGSSFTAASDRYITVFCSKDSSKISSNLDAAISTRLATSGYTAPPTVIGIRQEMDSNSTKLGNLDAAVVDIKDKTDNLPTAMAGATGGLALVGSEMILSSSEEESIANTLLDLTNGVENGETLREFFRIIRAVLAGQSTTNNGTVQFKRSDGSTVALTVAFTTQGSRTSSTVGDV